MSELDFSSKMNLGITGRVMITSVPADVEDPLAPCSRATVLFDEKNLVVNSAGRVISELLRGRVTDFVPAFITLGAGGDHQQDARIDVSERVGPEVTDTYVRHPLYRIPIISTENGDDSLQWSFVAVAKPHEAISPIINELGLESRNGTLLSHYVTDADASGRATKYCKTSLEYLVIRWHYTLELFINVSNDVVVGEPNYAMQTQDSSGTFGLLATVLTPEGPTTQGIPTLNADNVQGTLAVQDGGTIDSADASNTAGSITLEEQ